MKDLLFKRPRFQKGLNVTVRSGSKWNQQIEAGDMVRLVDTDSGQVIQAGEILFVALRTLHSIPNVWLQFEHDLSCRTYEGLEAEMGRVYPEGVQEPVTVIGFMCTQAHNPEPIPEPAPVPEIDE